MVADIKDEQRLCYITCDPSCSGSGMNLHTDQGDKTLICSRDAKTPEDIKGRIEQLSKFQFKLLQRALDYYPVPKFVTYSTCSIYPEEDELLVEDILRKNPGYKVPDNLQEILEKVFQLKKDDRNEKSLKEAGAFIKGAHVMNSKKNEKPLGVKMCPKCSKGRFNGFFCTVFVN